MSDYTYPTNPDVVDWFVNSTKAVYLMDRVIAESKGKLSAESVGLWQQIVQDEMNGEYDGDKVEIF